MAVRAVQGILNQGFPDNFSTAKLNLNANVGIQIISIDMYLDANSMAIWQASSFHTIEISLSKGDEPEFITKDYSDIDTLWIYEHGVKSGDPAILSPMIDRGFIPQFNAPYIWLALHTQFTNVSNRLNYKLVYDEVELSEIEKLALGIGT